MDETFTKTSKDRQYLHREMFFDFQVSFVIFLSVSYPHQVVLRQIVNGVAHIQFSCSDILPAVYQLHMVTSGIQMSILTIVYFY